MLLEEKINQLTEEIEGISLQEVAVENRPAVQKYRKELLNERSILQGALVGDDLEHAWRMTFEKLQSRPPAATTNQHQTELALPAIVGSAQSRVRVETTNFIFRKCFDEYEQTLLDPEFPVTGLIGPQGFGKTVLLRYLHAKYLFSDDFFVIHVPSMIIDVDLVDARERIQAEFYRNCALRRLDYAEFGHIQTLSSMIREIRNYAEGKNLTLLIIIDQLRAGDEFRPLFNAISSGFAHSARRHKVIVSSSTSRTCREVFEPYANHVRFQDFTTPSEAQDLAVPGVDVKDLTGISFLEAVRRTRPGAHKSLAEDATYYWTTYLAQNLANDSCKAEHMLVFHGVLSEECFDNDVELSDAVDSDTFFWHVVGPCRRLMERRQGLAQHLLKKLKADEETYVDYLHSMVDSRFFSQLPRRTKGNILEDCFAAILCEKRQPVTFQFTKLDGKPTNPNRLPISKDRVIIHFEMLSLADIEFRKDRVIVALPDDPDYASVDFVVIHVVDESQARLWFIQSTVQTPRNHGSKETKNFDDWIKAVEKYLTVTHKRLVFLTPNATPHQELSYVPTALKASEVLHCDFTANVTGNHVLVKSLKKTGAFE